MMKQAIRSAVKDDGTIYISPAGLVVSLSSVKHLQKAEANRWWLPWQDLLT